MKCLILIWSNPASRQLWEGLSNEERSVGLDAYDALTRSLAASGELVECESIERAIAHAARVPEAELGLVEVRPVMNLSGFLQPPEP